MRQLVLMQPHRARHRLAHLSAIGGGDERRGDAVNLGPVHAARQFDAVDDITPLVGPAHLQAAPCAARQFQEIIGLEDHVVEFEEGQRLLAVEPQLDRIKLSIRLTEKCCPSRAGRGCIPAVEPLGVIEHDRIGGPSPNVRYFSKTPKMPALLFSMSWSDRSGRAASLPEGSPTL